MRKTSTFLLIIGLQLLFSATRAQSKSAAKPTPKAGMKAGMSAGQLSSYDGSRRLSIHTGFFVNFNPDKKWRIQPEIFYSGEGQHYSFEGSKRTIAMGYAQLPVMFQYFAADKFYFEFGPQLGFLLHASSSGDDLAKLNVKRSFNNSQFAVNAGAGVQVDNRYSFYGRYQFGLTDVTLGEIIDHSRVIMIGLKWQFK